MAGQYAMPYWMTDVAQTTAAKQAQLYGYGQTYASVPAWMSPLQAMVTQPASALAKASSAVYAATPQDFGMPKVSQPSPYGSTAYQGKLYYDTVQQQKTQSAQIASQIKSAVAGVMPQAQSTELANVQALTKGLTASLDAPDAGAVSSPMILILLAAGAIGYWYFYVR